MGTMHAPGFPLALAVTAATLASVSPAAADPSPVTVLNRGLGGANTRDGLRRFATHVEEVLPDHLVIYYGVNDSANSGKLVPLEEFRRNLQTMVERARAVGTESIVLVTMNPIVAEYWALRHPTHPRKDDIEAYMATYDAAIRDVALANGLPIADLRKLVEERGGATMAKQSLIRNEANSSSRDGVHLTRTGYRLMAWLLKPILGPKVKPGDVVVCLGDSLTYGSSMLGQGTSCGRTYPAWLWLILNQAIGATDRMTPLDPEQKP